uniref:Mediator of RNA polymerase II transcription subunit 9 n=1 Tax=Bursaphelenchus xylophilus TaxID=6326 RepID=A0A1I7S2A1_BURXY
MAANESNQSSVQKCREILDTLEQNYSGLLSQLIQRSGAQSTNQAKVTQIYTSLINLRNAVENLPDIDQDLESQIEEIGALRQRLHKKNEFIKRIQSGEFNKYDGEDTQ